MAKYRIDDFGIVEYLASVCEISAIF
jgi:hypothetical protein